MRVVICAGPTTTGKTSVLRHLTRKLLATGRRAAFLKLDVQYADEDELLAAEFGIPTRKVYSGELCPDHCHVMVLGDALAWAERSEADVLLVETAGLCLRCSPYVDGGLGLVVLEATSGMNLPLKVGPMLSLADVAVVTKIDRVSQAEREVFRARIQDAAPRVLVREVNALHGIGIDPLVDEVLQTPEVTGSLYLRGNPPVGTCTICVGKKEIGWQAHFGVVRALESQTFYRGE
jgi:Ni2+-binding GTPase involved in maturation of urease and hydrogenase